MEINETKTFCMDEKELEEFEKLMQEVSQLPIESRRDIAKITYGVVMTIKTVNGIENKEGEVKK